ncbi:MAG TPA: LysR family transcriptional regulator [Sphingomonadaceae bacterium]|nr:LysR family transcriptional regulator [Sphingomonadaceae bacterium]
MATLKLKLQLMHGGEIAMGPGKAELLDRIEETGSISAAARAMGMSYRRAWLLVDAMNRCFAEPLVETRPGGGKQAGAQVTEAGKRVREAYGALVEMAEQSAHGVALGTLTRALRK